MIDALLGADGGLLDVVKFRELDEQISQLNHQATQQSGRRSLDEDWALFEAHQELEELRRRQGLS